MENFGILTPSNLNFDWPKWFRSDFSRAFERCLSFFSTATRSRDHGGGGVQTPPPPSRRWKIQRRSRARVKSSILGEFSNIYLLSAQSRVKLRHIIGPIASNFRPILIFFFAWADATSMPKRYARFHIDTVSNEEVFLENRGGRIRPSRQWRVNLYGPKTTTNRIRPDTLISPIFSENWSMGYF